MFSRIKPGPKVIKLFSCSTQLSIKFVLLINLKLLKIANSFLLNIAEHETIVGIFIFISTEISCSAHLCSLVIVCMKKLYILEYSKCAQGRFCSDCVNVQADLNLCLKTCPKVRFLTLRLNCLVIFSCP